MVYVSEAKRLNHPQARLIPESMWRTIFYYDLSKYEIMFMTCSYDELLNNLTDIATLDSLQKMRICYVITLSHNTLSNEILIHIYNKIGISNNSLFVLGAVLGSLSLFQQIAASVLPVDTECMVSAFIMAAAHGNMSVMREIIKLAPDKLMDMIAAENYSAFRFAAANGHLLVLQELLEFAPDKAQEMIESMEYEAFLLSARYGHLPVMQMLWLQMLRILTPDQLINIIAKNNYMLFRMVAENGHLLVLQELIRLAPDRKLNMIEANDFEPFRDTAKLSHLTALHYLLSFHTVFAYAEHYEQKYNNNIILPFIHAKLTSLHAMSAKVELNNPNAVFDITDTEEITLVFYILKNMIHRHDPALQEEIHFLQNIPAVKARAHATIGNQSFFKAVNNEPAGAENYVVGKTKELSGQTLAKAEAGGSL